MNKLRTFALVWLVMSGCAQQPGARLALHDTGELRILEGTQQLWTSGTCCH